MPRRVALLAPLLAALLLAAAFVPFVTREREMLIGTPQPPPLFAQAAIGLEPGQAACAGPFALDTRSDAARIVAAHPTPGKRPALRVTVRAGGRVRESRFTSYADGGALDVPLDGVAPAVDGEVCVRNAGAGKALLRASAEERTFGRLSTKVGGRRSEANLLVALVARERASLWERRAEVGRRAVALAPSFAPGWVIGLLGALVVAGIPAGVAIALRRAPADDDAQP